MKSYLAVCGFWGAGQFQLDSPQGLGVPAVARESQDFFGGHFRVLSEDLSYGSRSLAVFSDSGWFHRNVEPLPVVLSLAAALRISPMPSEAHHAPDAPAGNCWRTLRQISLNPYKVIPFPRGQARTQEAFKNIRYRFRGKGAISLLFSLSERLPAKKMATSCPTRISLRSRWGAIRVGGVI